MKRLKSVTIILTLSMVLVLCFSVATYDSSITNRLGKMITVASSNAVYKKGSTGEMVKQIQRKLQSTTAYKGKIDGVFGSETEAAVKKYQGWVGLTRDGIVGERTLNYLGISTSNNTSSSYDRNLNLMATAIHAEARGESYSGKVAVGAVILNRVRSSAFPNTIAGVIYQPGAFTAVDDGQINLTPNEESKRAARDAMNGWDPTGGCIYYWNPVTATSDWIFNLKTLIVIGKHHFAKGGY